jgi:hypothetical protein
MLGSGGKQCRWTLFSTACFIGSCCRIVSPINKALLHALWFLKHRLITIKIKQTLLLCGCYLFWRVKIKRKKSRLCRKIEWRAANKQQGWSKSKHFMLVLTPVSLNNKNSLSAKIPIHNETMCAKQGWVTESPCSSSPSAFNEREWVVSGRPTFYFSPSRSRDFPARLWGFGATTWLTPSFSLLLISPSSVQQKRAREESERHSSAASIHDETEKCLGGAAQRPPSSLAHAS